MPVAANNPMKSSRPPSMAVDPLLRPSRRTVPSFGKHLACKAATRSGRLVLTARLPSSDRVATTAIHWRFHSLLPLIHRQRQCRYRDELPRQWTSALHQAGRHQRHCDRPGLSTGWPVVVPLLLFFALTSRWWRSPGRDPGARDAAPASRRFRLIAASTARGLT